MSSITFDDKIEQHNLSLRDFVLLAFGFGCLIGYSRMFSLGFTGYLSGSVLESTDHWYVLRCIATLATLLLITMLSKSRKNCFGTWTIAAATAASAAAVIVFAFDADGSFGWIVALLGGCAIAVLMFIWLLILSSYRIFDIVMTAIAGAAIAGFIVMCVPRINAEISVLVAIASACLAGLSSYLLDSNLSSCVSDGLMTKEAARIVPWFSLMALVICGIVATVVYGIAEQLTWLYNWSTNYIAFGISALATIAATFAIMLVTPSWERFVWVPQVVLVIAALALSCFSIRESLQISVGFLLASVFCTHFLHWAVFAAILSQCGHNKAFLAGLLLFVSNNSLAAMAGNFIGSSLPHSMQNLGGVAGISTITLVALLSAAYLVIWLLCANDAIKTQSEPESDVDSALKARLEGITRQYELTPRESEVALLTAQGYSGAYISQKLVVSNSTVRFHQQNLYRKLGVHSRDDFIELARTDENMATS